MSQQNEKKLTEQMNKINEELVESKNKINEFGYEITYLKEELEKKKEKLLEESQRSKGYKEINEQLERKILQLKAMKYQPELKEQFERISWEKANVDKQVKELKWKITEKDHKIDELKRGTESLKHQITESSQENVQFNRLYKKVKVEKEQLESVLADKTAELDRVLQEQAESKEGMHQLEIHYNHIQNELLKCEEQLGLSRQNEKILSEQMQKMNEEFLTDHK